MKFAIYNFENKRLYPESFNFSQDAWDFLYGLFPKDKFPNADVDGTFNDFYVMEEKEDGSSAAV